MTIKFARCARDEQKPLVRALFAERAHCAFKLRALAQCQINERLIAPQNFTADP